MKSTSEIVEEGGDEQSLFADFNAETNKQRIREIIKYQKSMYLSSSPSPSLSSCNAPSCSSFYSSRRSNRLLDLMREGNTSLRRLFDMEHTSLETHFKDYSGSPITKPVLLWGTDTDDDVVGENSSTWAGIVQPKSGFTNDFESVGDVKGHSHFSNRRSRNNKQRLRRKKSFRMLPGLRLWRHIRFRFRFRLRRLRIMICRRKF